MHVVDGDSGGDGCVRLLSHQQLADKLGHYRLMSYETVRRELAEVRYLLRVLGLWRDVFGDDPPTDWDRFDLECEFVGRVHREMFPLDLGYMDMLVNSGVESALDEPIAIDGYGVPWEFVGNDELDPEMQPMVTVLGEAGMLRSDDDGWLVWPDDGIDQLRALPSPFDGLAVAYHCVMRDSNNLFITSSRIGEDEYMWDPYEWTADNVRSLAQEYEKAKPDLARLDAYQQWFEKTQNTEEIVLEMLRSICEPVDGEEDG